MFLINFEKFAAEIARVRDAAAQHNTAEVEWRLGTIKDGHFESRVYDLGELMDKYKWDRTTYTVFLYNGGVRVRDGKAERKRKIAHADIDYCPMAMRLSVATEEPTATPNDIPTGTREIERWTAPLKTAPAHIMVSRVEGQAGFEVELEFSHLPEAADFTGPLEEIMPILLPDRPNCMHAAHIRDAAREYNEYWRDMPATGFLRKIGYKPVNFVADDCELVKKGYILSNKLDGVKYTLIENALTLYAVSEVDAFCLGAAKEAADSKWYDGEWWNGVMWLFDTPMRDDTDYLERHVRSERATVRYANKRVDDKPIYTNPPGAAALAISSQKDWAKNNDGIMFTPDKEPYLAARDRPHRTLKWKIPDKISIDLRLVEKTRDSKMRSFQAYAQDRNDRETRMDFTVIITRDDPCWDFADGAIAEVGLRGSEFYVMRPRYDKRNANFITVVQETLKDMRTPFTLSALLACLGADSKKTKTTGGLSSTDTDLLPEPTDATINAAYKWVEADREEFKKAYMCVLSYAKQHDLRLSNPECLAGGWKAVRVLNLFAQDGLRTANDIANALYELTPIIFMKTVLPYAEFEVSVLNRAIARIYVYPKVRHVRTQDLFTTIPLQLGSAGTGDLFQLHTLSAEIELIGVYHRLYQPFPDNWAAARELADTLIQDSKLLSFPSAKHGSGKPDRSGISEVRTALHAALAHNDLGVLVGHWGYQELAGVALSPAKPEQHHLHEKVQLLTELEPAVVCEKVENLLRDVTPVKLQWKTEELYIPADMHLRRTTYYFETGGNQGKKRVPLLDTFNSLSYEIVPYVTGRNKMRVGNPYVLQRFFLIDYWMLGVLQKGGYLTAQVAGEKRDRLITAVRALRVPEYVKLRGGDEYTGTYKDLAIERRRLLKAEEKFRPYKPLEYFEQHGKLRQLGEMRGTTHSGGDADQN